jgi:hypothetical protein
MRCNATLSALACTLLSASSVLAADIDSLSGKFAFDWFAGPETSTCVAVDGQLLSSFKSTQFSCNLDVITNTSSGAPAQVCTKVGGGGEYLIFNTRAQCDEERETQASNSEDP